MFKLIMAFLGLISLECVGSDKVLHPRDASLVVIIEVAKDHTFKYKVIRNTDQLGDSIVRKLVARKDEGRYLYLRKEIRDLKGNFVKSSTVVTRIVNGMVRCETGILEGKIVEKFIPEKEFVAQMKKLKMNNSTKAPRKPRAKK